MILDRRHCAAAILLSLCPAAPAAGQSESAAPEAHGAPDPCAERIAAAAAAARSNDLEAAERLLTAADPHCADSGHLTLELAGLRFRQRRYAEAASLAARAAELVPADEYAWELLAASRFMLGDAAGALAAWNRLHRPVIRDTRILGSRRTPERTLEHALGIRSADVLAPAALVRARRRVSALPAVRGSRVEYRPVAGGAAELEVAVAERPVVARDLPELLRHGIVALAEDRILLDAAGPLGRGESWSAEWGWRRNGGVVEVGLATPYPFGAPFMLEVRGGRRTGVFLPREAPDAGVVRETRRAFSVLASDWASAVLRWSAGASVDRWSDRGTFTGLTGAVELRDHRDRAAMRAQLDGWWSNGGSAFRIAHAGATLRSRPAGSTWEWTARLGAATASSAAPLDLWPRAGTGRMPSASLRAHPLLRGDGVVAGPFLAPRLVHAGVELVRWRLVGPVRAGVAVFGDGAAARRPQVSSADVAVDVGVGLRLAVPGLAGALRVDAATGLLDDASAFSVGWVAGWPGW